MDSVSLRRAVQRSCPLSKWMIRSPSPGSVPEPPSLTQMTLVLMTVLPPLEVFQTSRAESPMLRDAAVRMNAPLRLAFVIRP